MALAAKAYEPLFSDLDTSEYKGGSVLIHSPYGIGKTHLLGDFLRYYKDEGGKVVFINFKGEGGFDSIKNMGLGNIKVDVNSYTEFKSFLDWAEKKGYTAAAYDSYKAAYELTIDHKTGGAERAPLVGDFASNEWPDIHMWMRMRVLQSQRIATHTLWVCPTDTGKDLMKEVATGIKTPTKLYPDLPGKMAAGSIGMFNLVGYLFGDLSKEQGMVRKLDFRKNAHYETRQRMPVEINRMIDIPQGGGGWKNVVAAITEAYAKGGSNGIN